MSENRKNSFIARLKRLITGNYSCRTLFLKAVRRLPCPLLWYKVLQKLDGKPSKLPKAVILPDLRDCHEIVQFVHPDVVLFDGDIILAVTPYPYADDRYENPVLFRSQNLKTFEPLNVGRPAAVSRYSAYGKCYLSDPDLATDGNRLYLYYREYELKDAALCRIYRIYSEKLADWSAPELLFEGAERDFVCPASVYDGKLITFFVRFTEDGSYLYRSEDNNFENSQPAIISGVPSGRSIWHIDVFIENYVYFGLFLFFIQEKESIVKYPEEETVLYSAVSKDKGKSWRLIRRINPFDGDMKQFTRLYRSTFVKQGESGSLIFSAETKKGQWFTLVEHGISLKKYFI